MCELPELDVARVLYLTEGILTRLSNRLLAAKKLLQIVNKELELNQPRCEEIRVASSDLRIEI
jgi:hypothetical protein